MKCTVLFSILVGLSAVCEAQSPNAATLRTTYQSLSVLRYSYSENLGGCYRSNGLPPFRPSGATGPANGGQASPRVLNTIKVMDISYVVKAHSLPPKLYSDFARRANVLSTSRGAALRRLLFTLPSRMVGTTYVPPEPQQIMECLAKVEKMTEKDLERFWGEQ